MKWPILLALACVCVACASSAPMADFGPGTERVTPPGNPMLRWGFEVYKYKTNEKTRTQEKERVGFQPTYETIYSGVHGGSIILEHKGYKSVKSSNGWTTTEVWVLASQNTTYHPVNTKSLSINGATIEVLRADGDALHFRVKDMDVNLSKTLKGPTETTQAPTKK